MGIPLPKLPNFKDSWPVLFLVAVVALHPVPGGLLVTMGVVSLWSTRAPGLWPWQADFWDKMQWTVGGAVGVFCVGTLLHIMLVRPIFDAARAAWAG